MKSKLYLVGLIVSVFLISSCATMRVAVNYDKDINFSEYKTFRFVFPKQVSRGRGKNVNPFFTKDMMNEIRPIMIDKGYEEAGKEEEADLLLHFYTHVQNQRDWVPATYRVGRWGRVHRTSPGHVVHYKEGTLGIDIVDQEKKALVWQGIGKGVLDRTNPQKSFVEAVEEVLAQFPPK